MTDNVVTKYCQCSHGSVEIGGAENGGSADLNKMQSWTEMSDELNDRFNVGRWFNVGGSM